MALWRRLLAGSEWSHLLDVLSPALFDVISPRQLSARAAELAKNWFNQEGAAQLARRLDESAADVDLGLRIRTASFEPSIIPFRARIKDPQKCSVPVEGDFVLRFFFFQIYASESVFLDLRASRFGRKPEDDVREFYPLPLWATWRPEFVRSIRQLYDGFYGNDEGAFDRAVEELGIAPAADVFRQAFGGEKKRASRYTVAEFRETFHQVFVRCRDAKAAFHPDFVTLGIAIATLYDHLETLGGCYDVLAAHQHVRASLERRSRPPECSEGCSDHSA
ncbi:MAG: hypothetical protein QM784_26120 [Polyangiaceae bacterium]